MSTTSLGPPDGGWGWVVVFASFVCTSVVDGVCNSYGLFLPHIMAYFGESRAKSSLAGSLMAGGFLSVGPVVSAVIHQFGCRTSMMSGAILTTAALVLCRFSPNIDVFIFFFGIAGGVGLGFIYLPSMVMVGYYFDRHRALALGIVSAGAGAGMLAIAPACAFFLSQFDWKNSCMLMAAFPLQCLVMGALMRPMDMRRDQSTESFVGDNGNSHDIEKKAITRRRSSRKADCALLTPGWLQTSSYHDVRKLDTIGRSFAAITEHDGRVTNTPTSHNVTDHVMNTVHTTANDHMRHESHVTSRHSKSAGNLAKPTNRCHHVRQVGASVGHRSRSCGELTAVSTRRPSAARKCDGFHASADPLHRKDLIYGGSLAALAVVEFPPARRALSAGAREPSRRAWRGACSSLGNLLDLSVLRNVYFVIISFASVFIQLGYYIPFVFLADYAASLGVDPSSTASLLVIIGVTNTIGRVTAGALANVPSVNILHLNNVSLVITGVATALCGALCNCFAHLAIYAAVFGFFVAAFVPLSTMFLINYLRISKLTKAFGLLSLVRGLSSVAGPPIAGAIRDASTSYSPTFYFAGALFVTAGLVHYLLPVVDWWRPATPPPHDASEVVVNVCDDDKESYYCSV
ncbi:hypothetical protein NP493_3g11038 [Ridgeia piscesae]|uniref:Major facilitator superfamily (MFS) profile domain-containing protein n=1 Tax=Ridgeia piscesae TaxID=27915 RepID=A0AAD9PFW9_RIDPI|nr:hypothetical protein NP493_3g11038 [Ridgeia piscesae]